MAHHFDGSVEEIWIVCFGMLEPCDSVLNDDVQIAAGVGVLPDEIEKPLKRVGLHTEIISTIFG